VRRLLARLQIRHRAVDLDSVEYQQDDRGGHIRAALAARKNCSNAAAWITIARRRSIHTRSCRGGCTRAEESR
jgi:hypothetical protein